MASFATVLLAVSVIFLPGVLSQTLTAVSLLDGTGRSGISTGRIMVTVVTTVGGTSVTVTGTVCDPVNPATALFLCNQLGFAAYTRTGTVTQLNVPQGTGNIAIRNLDCSGAATLAACRFNTLTTAGCSHIQDAALECGGLTPGAVAGIVIALLIILAILVSVPIVIVCCCCCFFGAACHITLSKNRW